MVTRKLEEVLQDQRVCPQCGAPVVSEICSYCGANIADYEELASEFTAEYPTLPCKPARLSFFGTIFPLIFFLCFGIIGVFMPLMTFFMSGVEDAPKWLVVLIIPFAAISIGFGISFFKNIISVAAVALRGEKIKATVYGYMDDTVAYNGNNGKIVKLLIDTPQGKRFIFLPLEATNKPYQVNSTITVKHYKNFFTIVPEEVW